MRSVLAALLLVAGCSAAQDEELPAPPRAYTWSSKAGRVEPTPHVGSHSYVSVRAGDGYTCARTAAGTVDCAGLVHEPPHFAAELAVRRQAVCVLSMQGEVSCAGDTNGFVLPEVGAFHSLGLGDRFACALDGANHPRCWGPAAPRPPADLELTELAVGWMHVCGLRKSDRTIVCWGDDRSRPPSRSFVSIAAGGLMSCALDADQHVECWGEFRPDASIPPSRFTQVSIGDSVACGVLADAGQVKCWGNIFSSIHQVPAGRRYSEVSVGTDHACAILTVDGTVECWGGDGSRAALP